MDCLINKRFNYLNVYTKDMVTIEEFKEIYKSFLQELNDNTLDQELVPYLKRFFNIKKLIPCFSCSGHYDSKGYILFKSSYSIEVTIEIFRTFYQQFSMDDDVNISLHFWPSGAIGYCLEFTTKKIKPVLTHLINTIESI